MQRFEFYRPVVFRSVILALMFAVPSITLGQEEGDKAAEPGDSAAPAAESASRALVWTGTGNAP